MTGSRINHDDDLFVRSHRVLGIPVIAQEVWRFSAPLPTDAIEELRKGLAGGRFGRRIVPATVPGARARWVRCTDAPPVRLDTEPLEASAILSWAGDRADTELDPARGAAWRLAYAPTSDGGSVLSLVFAHAIADGGAHFAALQEVSDPVPLPEGPAGIRADLVDLGTQLVRAGRGIVRAIRNRRVGAPRPGVQTATVGDPGSQPDTAVRPPTVVLDCDGAAWDDAVRARGGSSNALFLALAAEILLEAGRVRADAPLKVTMPVSRRTGPDDLRANATTGVSIVVEPDGEGGFGDLAKIRASTKHVLSTMDAPAALPPVRALEPLMQFMPDRLVKRFATSAPMPLSLCSNLGTLPESFTSLLGVPATSVLMRAVPGNLTRGFLRTRGSALNLWCSRTGDTQTLTLLALDPDHFPDSDALRSHALAVLARWAIPASPW